MLSVKLISGCPAVCRWIQYEWSLELVGFEQIFPIDTTAFRCLKSMKPCEVAEAGGDTRCYSFFHSLVSDVQMKHQTSKDSIDTSETRLKLIDFKRVDSDFATKMQQKLEKTSTFCLETYFASYEISRSQSRVAGGVIPKMVAFETEEREDFQYWNEDLFQVLQGCCFGAWESFGFFEGKNKTGWMLISTLCIDHYPSQGRRASGRSHSGSARRQGVSSSPLSCSLKVWKL